MAASKLASVLARLLGLGGAASRDSLSSRLGRNPLFLLLLIKLVEALSNYITRRRQLRLGWKAVTGKASKIDTELIQGCLITTENFFTLGRIEKRTLFVKPILEVVGGNEYLVQQLLKASTECRTRSHNCIVPRWCAPDDRYHILQGCLNTMSAQFGPNYVHFNAVGDETNNVFKSTWYCLTISTPSRPVRDSHSSESAKLQDKSENASSRTATFTDMSRQPRPTLRVMLVNESELRRIADGKMSPPSWGFFNKRHAERYAMLQDFARVFQRQLVLSPADSKNADPHNPMTSEQVHRPDGGLIKRVMSQPNLAPSGGNLSGNLSKLAAGEGLGSSASSNRLPNFGGDKNKKGDKNSKSHKGGRHAETQDGGSDESCFLRLHVPHYVGAAKAQDARIVVMGSNTGGSPEGGGFRKVHSSASISSPPPALGGGGGGNLQGSLQPSGGSLSGHRRHASSSAAAPS